MEKELQTIQEYLEEVMSDDVGLVIERGALLQVYLARTGKMLADAKLIHNAAKTAEIMDILKETAREYGSSHTATNELVKACCRHQQYTVDWCERLNRTIVHQLDFLRSVLSKAKEEMKYNYQNFHHNP